MFVTKAQLHRQLAVKVDPSVVKKEEPYNWRNYYKIRNNIIFDKRILSMRSKSDAMAS